MADQSGELRREFAEIAVERWRVLGTLMIDGAFLVAVVAANFLVSWGVGHFEPHGADAFVMKSLHWGFAVSTVVGSAYVIVLDLGKGARRLWESRND